MTGTSPGPTADRIAELEDERAQLLQCLEDGSNDQQIRAEIAKRDAELSRLKGSEPRVFGEDFTCNYPDCGCDHDAICEIEAERRAPSPATSPGPQDVRKKMLAVAEKAFAKQLPNAIAFNEEGDAPGAFYFEGRFELYPVLDALLSAFPALAQSDAQPECVWPECGTGLSDECDTCPTSPKRQSDAQPVGWLKAWREALEFYSDKWKYRTTNLGLEWDPDEALLEDCGNRAKEALEAVTQDFDEAEKRIRYLTTPPSLPEGAREALEPFAREADKFASEWSWQRRVVTLTWSPDLTVGDFRRAKVAQSATPTPSSAGLIEAAEWLEMQARGEKSGTTLASSFYDAATALRGSARDTSGLAEETGEFEPCERIDGGDILDCTWPQCSCIRKRKLQLVSSRAADRSDT